MYLLLVTLLFSLTLGPDVKLLNAVEADEAPMSKPTKQNMVLTESTPDKNSFIEERTMRNKDLTIGSLSTEAEYVVQTSGENTTALNQELNNTTELLTTPEPTAILESPTIMTYDLSTSTGPPEATSQPKQEEETTMTNIFNTEAPQTPSPSTTIPDSPAFSTEPPVLTPAPTSNEEVETTDTSPTTTPTPTTTTITTTQEQTMLSTPESDTSTHPKEMTSTTTSGTGVISAESNKDSKGSRSTWLIITVIALVIFCILITFGIMAIIIKRRKQSGKQHFGYTNGQRSKKNKVAKDDVWAGPVKLGGGDCESPDEGDAQGEEKTTDGVEVTGLSTFATLEENGGVGRPGSPEVEKWEEKEPLLFIDEEGKEKGKEAGKSEDADAKEGVGKAEVKNVEPNRAETFCLTTAV